MATEKKSILEKADETIDRTVKKVDKDVRRSVGGVADTVGHVVDDFCARVKRITRK